MKKLFVLFVLLFVLCLGVVTTSCGKKENAKTSENGYNAMYQEAVSGINYLSANKELMTPVRRLARKTVQAVDVEAVISKVNGFAEAKVEATTLASDLEEYDTLVEIKAYGKTYKMYYNQNDVKSLKEEEIDDDETETKELAFYQGIVILDDETYRFKAVSKKEVEKEETEEEIELKFDMYIFLNETSDYILIEQEKETENVETEEKFKYTLVKSGDEKIIFEIEIKEENGKRKIELFENGKEYEVEFFTKRNVNYVEIEVDDDEYTYRVETQEDGLTSYILVE